MFEIEQDPRIVERAYLVGVQGPDCTHNEAREHLDELVELVNTMGIPIVGTELLRADSYQARLLLGSGKAEWIETELRRLNADCLLPRKRIRRLTRPCPRTTNASVYGANSRSSDFCAAAIPWSCTLKSWRPIAASQPISWAVLSVGGFASPAG